MAWKCENCGWTNFKDSWIKCENCQAERDIEREQNRLEQEAEIMERRREEFMITTTPEFRGYEIQKYFGVVTSMIVLGTGLFAEIGAGFADFFGTRSSDFQRKLEEATKIFEYEITTKALNRNSEINALVGLKMDYSVGEKNMLLLCGTGTAVRIDKL